MQTLKTPDKLYYSIGEVRALTDLEPYVLRYWESEFPQLKPKKNSGGQRAYQRKDIELILRIKELLYEQGYTIKGARALLRGERRGKGDASGNGGGRTDDTRAFLKKLHTELVSLQKMIAGHKPEDLFAE
ncbi:MAG: MerR family transcriptional regulator [Verrucomicrobia bacterium]|nr:MerR family transcriptional regulator [Verrucomicrobiota bacterium]